MERKNRPARDPLPEEFEKFEDLSEFWDTHDVTDYAEYLTPVKCQVISHPTHEYVVTLSDTINTLMRKVQKREGVSINTLVNLWVQERLQKYQVTTF
ncbi:MAG: CopG family antitoxin [bacterium]|nr:CopG family antitoxin [bacterium]